ncbi:unannotated protein [freshwater metagenome]|uniref:Unannotated protein n=1 Tax=freshwater metagenome TaxID=449393 RepID=A0A6J6LN62_9ZZZZ
MVAFKGAHVFNHTGNAQETASCHVGCADCNLLCRDSRRGHDEKIGAGQHACKTHLHVTSARRHVDDEIVKVSPLHVIQELFDSFCEHQSTPHQSSAFVFDQHASGDNFEKSIADATFVRHDHRLVTTINLLRFKTVRHSQHARNGEAPNIGIENTNGFAGRGKSSCKVDGDRRFAHTTLATGDGKDARAGGHCGISGVLAGIPAGTRHDGCALIGCHLAPVDLHLLHPGMHFQAATNVLLNLGAQRAAADGELDPNGHNAVGHGDVPSHSEVDNVVSQFGVDDSTKEVADLFLGGRWGNSLAHKMKCTAVSELPLGMSSMKATRILFGGHHDHSHRCCSKESRTASR